MAGGVVIEDVAGEVLRKSVVVGADIADCYAVAANLDGYVHRKCSLTIECVLFL